MRKGISTSLDRIFSVRVLGFSGYFLRDESHTTLLHGNDLHWSTRHSRVVSVGGVVAIMEQVTRSNHVRRLWTDALG